MRAPALVSPLALACASLSYADIYQYEDCDNNGSLFLTNLDPIPNADLSNLYLGCADLAFSPLYSADLSGSDLSGANLYSGQLVGSNLTGANISSADLSVANLNSSTIDE